MKVDRIAVLGSGQMGRGIAQTAAQAGFEVLLSDQSPELAAKALDSIAGQLKRLELTNSPELGYQIMINNQPIYYIKAPRKRFDAFLNQQVSVEGTIDTQTKNKDPYPVLSVSKIQLIL